MEQLPKPERKNMDACLRRLRQELLSMKEAGDGLHAQMNSMMGALQELKLLQVQTALENLNISGQPTPQGPPQSTMSAEASVEISQPVRQELSPNTSASPGASLGSRATSHDDQRLSQHRSSLGTSLSSSSSSLESESTDGSDRSRSDRSRSRGSECSRRSDRCGSTTDSVPKRWSGYMAPQVDFCGPSVGPPPPEPPHRVQPAQAVDLPGILYSLSREGPSLDSDSQDSVDDSSDWTSSLMSRCRNRQPLVLGDNVFADLVGNWLDLPELERDDEDERERRGKDPTADGACDRPDTPAHPLRLSRSQEICRKFSLTTNIFKKFLRSVRPDRDKLLKERPGWVAPELPEGDLFKRPKKAAPKSSKGSFYLPFWAGGQQSKGRPCPQLAEGARSHHYLHQHYLQHSQPQQPFSGIYIDRRLPESRLERMQPLFDYNTAVWV